MILSTAILLLSCNYAAAQAPSVPSNQQLLDFICSKNHGAGGGVFRIGVGAHGVLWEGTSGLSQQGGVTITPDANFEIASTSKAFTAAAALLLVEEGLLQLDTPLGTYLPRSLTDGFLVIGGQEYGHTLTLRQLLQHTSGLGDYWYDPPFVIGSMNRFLLDYSLAPNHFWTSEEILSYVPGLDGQFLPGTDWHYSDSGYVITGMLLERVTGLSLQQVYATRIYQPLGLTDTWLHWREPQSTSLQETHRYEGQSDMYTKRHNSADWAGGGLVSSTQDLQLFLHGIASGTLFQNPASRDAMMSWVATDQSGIEYGLGLFRVPLGFGLGEIWGHDGYGNSWMYYWPRYDISFCGTLNQTENNWWPLVLAAALRIEYL
jgi:CubicO group peptidase (beta-lactamase class C family)